MFCCYVHHPSLESTKLVEREQLQTKELRVYYQANLVDELIMVVITYAEIPVTNFTLQKVLYMFSRHFFYKIKLQSEESHITYLEL